MTNLKAIVSAVLMSSMMGVANAKTLTIGVDLSASNPLVTSAPYALAAAKIAGERVAKLAPGDTVVLRTLGDRGVANVTSKRFQITRIQRADKVAKLIAESIAGLPSDPSRVQGSTHITAFLNFGQFDCANGGAVMLLTDGIESSKALPAAAFLRGKALPSPEKNILAGCAVTMVGLGQSTGGLPDKEINHIRAAWSVWMKTAGAAFSAVIDL